MKFDFDQEILKSEKLRIEILIVFFFTLLLGFVFVYFFRPQDFFISREQVENIGHLPIIYFAVVMSYFITIRLRIIKAIRRDERVPIFIRYLNATTEITLPTLSIYFISLNLPSPDMALHSPPFQVYYIFIILSVLRLDPWLAFYTGFLAACEYFGLFFYLKNSLSLQEIDSYYANLGLHLAKTMLLLAGGMVAGFVTSQLQRRITDTLNLIQERNRITNIFGQHVSPAVVDKLLTQKQGEDSEMKYVCMLFFDIRDFTKFSEDKDPIQVIEYLNYVFEIVVDSILRHNGVINKFLGDGLMAVFGAPISSGDDVERAIDSSLEILERIEKVNETNQNHPIDFGIGLHCGEAVTGNVGTNHRKEYTIIGDVVNLASRIEQLNKEFKTKILASEEVIQFADKEVPKFLSEVQVKGREKSVKVYKLA
jgi:adenylate cyclase